jgi:hypothetical protein
MRPAQIKVEGDQQIEMAAAFGVRRRAILAPNSALAINHWLLTIIGQIKTVLLLTNSG